MVQEPLYADRYMPLVPLMVGLHSVQFVELPTHLEQSEWQGVQRSVAGSTNLPRPQTSQAPVEELTFMPGRQEVQTVAAPVQLKQFEAHRLHLSTSRKVLWPQGLQVLVSSKRYSPGLQLVQKRAVPAQVLQESWHLLQRVFWSR
jgi:hypothetical protein